MATTNPLISTNRTAAELNYIRQMVTFELEDEDFGEKAFAVLELIHNSPVPATADHSNQTGVIDLRGPGVPIDSLITRFSLLPVYDEGCGCGLPFLGTYN